MNHHVGHWSELDLQAARRWPGHEIATNETSALSHSNIRSSGLGVRGHHSPSGTCRMTRLMIKLAWTAQAVCGIVSERRDQGPNAPTGYPLPLACKSVARLIYFHGRVFDSFRISSTCCNEVRQRPLLSKITREGDNHACLSSCPRASCDINTLKDSSKDMGPGAGTRHERYTQSASGQR